MIDHDELMRLWRKDLQRTNYGARRDHRPPDRLLSADYVEPQTKSARDRVKWQSRIAMRLRALGFQADQIAPLFGLTRWGVYYLWSRRNKARP